MYPCMLCVNVLARLITGRGDCLCVCVGGGRGAGGSADKQHGRCEMWIQLSQVTSLVCLVLLVLCAGKTWTLNKPCGLFRRQLQANHTRKSTKRNEAAKSTKKRRRAAAAGSTAGGTGRTAEPAAAPALTAASSSGGSSQQQERQRRR